MFLGIESFGGTLLVSALLVAASHPQKDYVIQFITEVPRLRVLGFAPPAEERPALDMACRLRGVQLLDRGSSVMRSSNFGLLVLDKHLN